MSDDKLALVTNEFWPEVGGVGRYVATLAKGLKACGCDVQVITNTLHNDQDRRFVIPILYKRIRSPRFILSVIRYFRYVLANRRDRSFFLCCYGALWVASCNLIFRLRYRYFIVLHGSELKRIDKLRSNGWIFRKLFDHLFSGASGIVCISRFVLEEYRKSTIRNQTQADAVMIYNAFNVSERTDSAEPVSSAGDRKHKDKFIVVGRVDYRKRIDLLIKALPLVKNPVTIHVVGDGPAKGSYERLLNRVGLKESRMLFHGRLSDEELDHLYDECGTLVACAGRYRSTVEGFGLTVIEAASKGKQVLAFDVDGAGEVARVIGAEVVAPEVRAIARKVDALSSTGFHSSQVSAEHVLDMFSPEKQARVFVEFARQH